MLATSHYKSGINKQVTHRLLRGYKLFGKEAAQAIRRFAAFTVATGTIYGFIRSVQTATKNALEFQRELLSYNKLQVRGGKALDSIRKSVDRTFYIFRYRCK